MTRCETLYPGGPHYYYDAALFAPTADSFALGAFAVLHRGDRVCDLGCGTGVLGTLLLAREPSLSLYNIELDPDAAALAAKAADENGWTAETRVGDLRDAAVLPAAGSMDAVICNPPYFSGGRIAAGARGTARSDVTCTLPDVCTAAERILRAGGKLFTVLRPDRLVDFFCAARQHALEPKRLRFVQNADGTPTAALIECRRGGKPSLCVLPPLTAESPEWDAIYFRN